MSTYIRQHLHQPLTHVDVNSDTHIVDVFLRVICLLSVQKSDVLRYDKVSAQVR